jgi:hypothetical protein
MAGGVAGQSAAQVACQTMASTGIVGVIQTRRYAHKNVTEMPDLVTMREFTQMDGGKWWLTEKILNDPSLYRLLVRTQIEELLALYQHYLLPELDSVGQPQPTATGLQRRRAVQSPDAGRAR